MGDEATQGKPVPVVLATKPYSEELVEMLRKQGPLASVLIVAVCVLWLQVNAQTKENTETVRQMAAKHLEAIQAVSAEGRQALKEQAESFRIEQERTERILGSKINLNAQKTKEIQKQIEELTPN